MSFVFFFFNDTATTEIYPLSLHDALPICRGAVRAGNRRRALRGRGGARARKRGARAAAGAGRGARGRPRSEEHTSELQSQSNLVCRLLLEKKKKHNNTQ